MASIRFQLGQDLLDYEFVDTEISCQWLYLVSQTDQRQWPRPQSLSVNPSPRHEVRDQLIAELDRVCDQLGLETRDLNLLHQWFTDQPDPLEPRASQLNRVIHGLEHQQRSGDRAWIMFRLPVEFDPRSAEIRPQQRSLWQHRPCQGDLCMGYGTVGKTLWHSFWDDDPHTVRNHLCRPQQFLAPELILYLGGHDLVFSPHHERRLQRWLAQHDLTGCIDRLSPEHRYPGQPLLARAVGDYQHLGNVITPWTEIRDIRIQF